MTEDAADRINNRFEETQRAYRENDPPVEVNQIWVAKDKDGSHLRRLRIMALHPDLDSGGGRMWFYEEQPAKMCPRLYSDRSGRTPEFNLRYVFKWEGEMHAQPTS